MEKAAMDDPFLADALEGYKNINLADAGLDALKEKLDKRVGAAAVPILNLKRERFTWVRAAAAIIIIVGIGLLVQQLVFNDRNKNSIAILEKDSKRRESVANDNIQIKPDSIYKDMSTKPDSSVMKQKQEISISPNSGSYVISTLDTNKKDGRANAVSKKSENETVPAGDVQVIASAEKKDESVKSQADFKRTIDDTAKTLNEKKVDAAVSFAKPRANQEYYDSYNKLNGLSLNNKYNYRVVDAQNNPVPFANVMNTRDNIGTYTDIRGNFNLVSSDSVLNVQIRSLGYNAANYKLVPSNVQSGDLVLKEDERKETFVQNRKVVSSLSRKDSAEIEEPEVGWGNYNTYVANNIQIPENVRPKNTRNDVELSFDIDKTGQPVNIKVTRSSQCKECDEEAIRLLKEGPKWKRKGRKSKATVSIAVDQK
jgi:TonB family protein